MRVVTGTFRYTDGSPIVNGILTLTLSQDAVAADGQVSPSDVEIVLYNTGAIPNNTQVYFNDELQPGGTYYEVKVETAADGIVWGPEYLQLLGAGPLDLLSIVPLAKVTPAAAVAPDNLVGPVTVIGAPTHAGQVLISQEGNVSAVWGDL